MEPPVYGARDHITFERDGPLAWIVIDNLAEQNRLSRAGVARLRHIADALRAEPSIHVVIVRGVGTEHFCTGVLNPALRASMSKDEVLKLVFLAGETFDALEALPQVVVAGLNGTSRAGGAELALACDIRFAAEHARMSMPEALWGGFPGAGGPVRLPGLVGRGRALELISTGREIAADEMLRIGLLERVVASAEFDTAVAEFAATIAKSGPLAIRGAKSIVRLRQDPGFRPARELSDALRRALETSSDVDEGIRAHLEQRPPNFTGR